MPLISIVIPAYNPGAYFEKCLRSIASQSFADYEVVVVDDGSAIPVDPFLPVKCGIPEKSVRVIRTSNAGPYAARRRGVIEAQGEYFMNIDADDELIGNSALAKIAAGLSATSADMLLINASSRVDGVVPLIDYSLLNPGNPFCEVAPVEPEAYISLFSRDYIYNSVWAKVVRRERMEGFPDTFPRIVMADDRMLDMDFLPSIRTMALLDEPLYFYRSSETSITHSGYVPDYYFQVCGVESRVLDWLDKIGFDEEAWGANFLQVTCGALLALSYNDELPAYELMDTFKAIQSQQPYIRAIATGTLSRLGSYEKMQLSLLESGKYKTLRAFMLARRFGSRVRSMLRGSGVGSGQ